MTTDASIRYWDRAAQRYAQRPIPAPAVYERKLELIRQRLRPGMQVMEFGCGTGTTAIALAPSVTRYLATDASASMIAIAQNRRNQGAAPELALEVATLETFADSPGAFDAVLGLNILHLLKDPAEAVTRVHRLLKPGGLFISSTPCLRDRLHVFRPLAALASGLQLTPQVRFLSRQELESILAGAGFELELRWTPERTPDSTFLIATRRDSPCT